MSRSSTEPPSPTAPAPTAEARDRAPARLPAPAPTAEARDRALLDFAVSHSPVIFFVSGAGEGRPVTFVSSNVERITGHPQEAYLADPGYGPRQVHPDDLGALQRRGEELRDAGRSIAEYRYRRADGEYVWLRSEVRSVAAGDGDAYVGCLVDVTPEKEAQARLQEAEELKAAIMEAALDAVVAVDESGRIIEFNPTAEAMFGCARASALGRKAGAVLVPPALRRSDWRSFLAKQSRSDGPVRFESEAVRADGRRFPVEVTVTHVRLRERSIRVAHVRDLSEPRRREVELREAREILEDAIESLSEGFALYDTEDRLLMCNERYREFNRLSADVLRPGMSWREFIRAGAERGQYVDANGNIDEWIEALAAKRGTLSGDEFQQSDGRWFSISHRYTRRGYLVVTRTEISQRKRMEETLRRSEARIRQILEACPVPVRMFRLEDGVILYESPASRALYGEPIADDTERDILVDARPHDVERYLQALRQHGMVDDWEVELQRADGGWFWGAVSARVVDDLGEKVVVSTTYDLTDRREAEEEIARQREALHHSEKMSALGELLAGVAHELNNPLSVVVGQALLLQETSSDPRIAERAAKIGHAADRCARIVKTFLAMARREPSESKAINLNEIVESTLEVTGYALRSAGVNVSLRLARELPPVWGDGDQLNQVLTNLMLNAQHALQHSSEPRRLKISTSFRKRTGQVVLKVKDNGPGVPDEIRSRIFEPFFTTKGVGSGTGIGLAVCDRIVEAHGGTLVLETRQGEGAAFAVRLPASGASIARRRHDDPMLVPDAPLDVLIVDDEPAVAELIADILREDGHAVEIAASGRAARRAIRRRGFDVILSDLRMPDMDGPALFRFVQEHMPARCETLAFVTGDTLSSDARAFLDSAGRPYIEKPITPADVRALVRRLVAGANGNSPHRQPAGDAGT